MPTLEFQPTPFSLTVECFTTMLPKQVYVQQDFNIALARSLPQLLSNIGNMLVALEQEGSVQELLPREGANLFQIDIEVNDPTSQGFSHVVDGILCGSLFSESGHNSEMVKKTAFISQIKETKKFSRKETKYIPNYSVLF